MKVLHNCLPVQFNFFPRQIACEIQAETGLHSVLFCFTDCRSDFLHKLRKKSSLVGEKQTSFCNASSLHG